MARFGLNGDEGQDGAAPIEPRSAYETLTLFMMRLDLAQGQSEHPRNQFFG